MESSVPVIRLPSLKGHTVNGINNHHHHRDEFGKTLAKLLVDVLQHSVLAPLKATTRDGQVQPSKRALEELIDSVASTITTVSTPVAPVSRNPFKSPYVVQ